MTAVIGRGGLNRSSPYERLSRPKVRRGISDEAFELFAAPPRGGGRGTEAKLALHVPQQRLIRLITRDFRVPRPPRRPDFARSASVASEFVHFGLGNREPETFRGARSLDAPNPKAWRQSGETAAMVGQALGYATALAHPERPLRTQTRDFRFGSQKRVRTPHTANAPAVWPGRSL